MSKWFKEKYSDSESESSYESSSSSSESSDKNKLNIDKWFKKKVNNEEESNKEKPFISLNIRKQKEIDSIKDFIINNLLVDFQECKNKISIMKKIIDKENSISPEFIETILFIKDNIQNVEKKDKDFYKAIKIYQNIYEKYEYIIKKYSERDNIAYSPTEVSKTEEEILNCRLNSIITLFNKNKNLDELINDSEEYPKIHIVAISIKLNELLNGSDLHSIHNILYKIVKNTKQYHIIDTNVKLKKNVKTDIDFIELKCILSISLNIFYKILMKKFQNCEPNTLEYNKLIEYETKIVIMSKYVLNYYHRIPIKNKKQHFSIISSILIDILYYRRYDNQIEKYYDSIKSYGDQIATSKAYLLTIYNNLLGDSNKYKKATDLLNGFNTDDICTEDIAILYNNILIIYGISSYNLNHITEAFWALQQIFDSSSILKLIGFCPHDNKTDLLIPFHRHTDIVKAREIYLICSVLIINREYSNKLFSKMLLQIMYKYSNEGMYISDKMCLEEKIFLINQAIMDKNRDGAEALLKDIHSCNDYIISQINYVIF